MPDSRADLHPTDADWSDSPWADLQRADSQQADAQASPATRRIDVSDVVARLRHLDASAEPAMVFSQLSAIFVPAFCDEVSIDLVEDGGHRYRIRRPSSAIGSSIGTSIPTANGTARAGANGGPRALPELTAPIGSVPDPEVSADSVTVEVRSPEGGVAGPPFAGVVTCAWREGYLPNAADGALIRLMVDHAVALIQRERLTSRVPDLAGGRYVEGAAGSSAISTSEGTSDSTVNGGRVRGIGDPTDSPIGTAVGIVMSLHHLDQTQAIDMLVRLSHRAYRQIRDVAGTIVDTGVVPDPGPTATAGPA